MIKEKNLLNVSMDNGDFNILLNECSQIEFLGLISILELILIDLKEKAKTNIGGLEPI